jgi:hypothetical protein
LPAPAVEAPEPSAEVETSVEATDDEEKEGGWEQAVNEAGPWKVTVHTNATTFDSPGPYEVVQARVMVAASAGDGG